MTPTDDPRFRAERRLKRVREFYAHLFIYLAVMTLLVIIDVVGGTNSGSSVLGLDWAYWPMAGWGFFVVLDGLNTARFTTKWEQRKLEQYMEEERQRDLQLH